MNADDSAKPHESPIPSELADAGAGDAPTPEDIAAEEPDTTDDDGMPVDNPSGG